MKIVSIKKVEDCFDGTSVYGYEFDDLWSRELIMDLQSLGEIDYYPDFPKPLFRLRGKNGMQVKGIEGEHTCKAIFPREGRDAVKKEFEDHFKDGH